MPSKGVPTCSMCQPRPIKLIRSGRPVVAQPTALQLSGEVPEATFQVWHDLEAQHRIVPSSLGSESTLEAPAVSTETLELA